MLHAFTESHKGFGYLSILLAVAWIVMIALADPAKGVTRPARIVYAGGMAATGVLTIIGLYLVFAGGWLGTAFPWVGFIAVALYAFLGAISRRALDGGRKTEALAGAACMVVVLLFGYWIMRAKPF